MLKSVVNNIGSGVITKKCVYEGVIASTALYGAKAWGMRCTERRKVNVLEMKCLSVKKFGWSVTNGYS